MNYTKLLALLLITFSAPATVDTSADTSHDLARSLMDSISDLNTNCANLANTLEKMSRDGQRRQFIALCGCWIIGTVVLCSMARPSLLLKN